MDQVEANRRRLRGGQKLAATPPGERLVISGISGYFPNSDNAQHFMESLLNKVDLCDEDERRWKHENDEIPRLCGKLNNIDKFDCGFFGISELQAHWMDPMCRLLFERTMEAIFDAGINPEELRGTNTGVFVGSCVSETEKFAFYTKLETMTYPIIGCERSMLAQLISYNLQLNGPSYICDTACSSGLYAFEIAYRAIREGKCDAAIVAATNLCTDSFITLQFSKLGILNMNTGCRPFDRDAAGYTRSEGIVAMILQKENCSRRVYAKIVHSKTNADGFKEKGITYPSSKDQLQLLKDVYEECGVDPTTLAFMEAHGTGTKVGDPEEISAIDKCFSRHSGQPLLIGSIKGNIGHSEPVAGLCSIIKVIFGMNFGYIPPNIHYDNPRPDIPALMEKRLLVITEKTKWPEFSRLAGINCFGFGGANCHVLLKRFNKTKDIKQDGIPRLVCFSGRTKQAVETIQNYLSNNDMDYEFIRLIQEVFSKDVKNHVYRGFSVLLSNTEIRRSLRSVNMEKKFLYLCVGNENVYSCSMLNELQKLLPFKETYKRSITILKKNSIQIQLMRDEPNNIQQIVILTVIVQVGIIDIFKALNITFDYLRGSSMGELTAAYANGTLTLEEVITASYTISAELQKCEEQTFEKLSTKLRSIIQPKPIKVNGMQLSALNKFRYGSPEYFLFNVMNSNLITESYPPFKNNSIIVNLDFKIRDPMDSIINLETVRTGSNVEDLLNCFGRLYELGYTPCVAKLFAEVKWPVSKGTPMLSHLIKWNHNREYYVDWTEQSCLKLVDEEVYSINLMGPESSFYKGHVIDGRILFPATGYIVLVWKLFDKLCDKLKDTKRFCFEHVKFLRATTFSRDGAVFQVTINKEGYFEVSESKTPVASGRVYLIEKIDSSPKPEEGDKDEIPLTQKDIYKELRLRGYQYKGEFKAVHQMLGNRGLINWGGKWIPFLDNMLQLFLIKEDTRSLAVPTGIDRLLIDPEGFLEYIETIDGENLVPCYVNKTTRSIHTESIQILGLRASTISRKRQIRQPVLECYKFKPNFLSTNISESAKINMQIILENKSIVNVQILETINDESDSLQPLSPKIVKVLEDLPLIQPEITLFTKKHLDIDLTGIQLETKKVTYDHSYLIYIGSNVLRNKTEFKSAISAIHDDGFIITVEKSEYLNDVPGFNIFTGHAINDNFVYLLKKSKQQPKPVFVDVSNLKNLDNWFEALKSSCKKCERIILYAHDDLSGILGLTNCIRREPNGEKVSCFFIRDKSAPDFHEHDGFYSNQIKKGMSVNVFQNGQWGTYRHLLCNPNEKVKTKHFCGNTGNIGDLSSLDWYQGNLSTQSDNICHIYYSSLNFKDVMLATGKLQVEAVLENRMDHDCITGFEFSGRDKDGNRVMGLSRSGANSNLVKCENPRKIPSDWSLEDAATVPVVYFTVLEAFKEAKVKHGQSILIHSGTGGIGQAALNVCRYYNCNVFTTVGTKEKKEYLIKHYPYIKRTYIGNSRNTTFEEMIFRETNGCGVDVVLNSLSEDKLHASVRCLANGGHFIEIGKFDLANDTRISADLLNKGCTYQGVMLDSSSPLDNDLQKLFYELMDKGYIKPLDRTVFEIDQLENAYRYMSTGKHIGKVLIKIRDEENDHVEITHYAIPKFYCDPDLSYIILGGLGGFGLELADWLMLRGAKTLILSSRNGVVTGYQQSRIRIWINNGLKVVISTEDITTFDGCKNLINKSNKFAPIGGIFNLAVELRDGLLENLTYSDFQASLSPKAYATIYLNNLSKELCPRLQQFVVFSSVSCGRGNAGQSNYGMSNSIMERICEQRKIAGLPALAIQWGAVGDVGLVAEMQKEATEIAIGGTLQQRISSCLNVLDKFLKQNEPVVSSIVVAEKFSTSSTDNLVDTVLAILGVSDIKSISQHATLAELGMDSMMAIEMRQTLEREFDTILSANDMRTLTFARLLEINESRENSVTSAKDANFDVEKLLIMQGFDKDNYHKTTVEVTSNKDHSKIILLLPGIEATHVNLATMMGNLKYSSVCLQYRMHGDQKTLDDIVQCYYPIAKDVMNTSNSFNIVAHSMGGALALELVSKLEEEGCIGRLVLIDSSPEYIRKLLTMFGNNFDEEFEVKLVLKFVESYLPMDKLPEVAERLLKAKTTEERKQIAIDTFPGDSSDLHKYMYESGQNMFAIIMAFIKYKFSLVKKLKSKVFLCKPSIGVLKDIPDDYCLSNYVEDLKMGTFVGDHLTILENDEMHKEINAFFAD